MRSRSSIQGLASEEPGRPQQQDENHHDEDDGIGGNGIEDLGQAFDHPQPEARDDGSHDRAHAADDHDGEDDDYDVGPHLGADVLDGGGENPGDGGKADAKAVDHRHHDRNIDPEGLHEGRIFRAGPEIGAKPRLLDQHPGGQAEQQRGDDHPAAIDRQEHEAQIIGARERGRDRIGLARHAISLLEDALDDEGETEGQQQAIERVETAQAADQQAVDDDAGEADEDGGEQQRLPIADAKIVQQHPGDEGAHHILRAMGEIDDVEHPEDERQAEAQHGVEGAVDDAKQKLAKERL